MLGIRFLGLASMAYADVFVKVGRQQVDQVHTSRGYISVHPYLILGIEDADIENPGMQVDTTVIPVTFRIESH
jgi:hypothetical protein